MLVGIQRGEGLDAKEGGKKQGLESSKQGWGTVMEQGKIVPWMRVLIRPGGLREPRHNRGKGPLLLEPMGKEVDTHIGQPGPHLDDFCPRGHRSPLWGVARAALGALELPLTPQAIEMTNTHIKGSMSLGDLVE